MDADARASASSAERQEGRGGEGRGGMDEVGKVWEG